MGRCLADKLATITTATFIWSDYLATKPLNDTKNYRRLFISCLCKYLLGTLAEWINVNAHYLSFHNFVIWMLCQNRNTCVDNFHLYVHTLCGSYSNQQRSWAHCPTDYKCLPQEPSGTIVVGMFTVNIPSKNDKCTSYSFSTWLCSSFTLNQWIIHLWPFVVYGKKCINREGKISSSVVIRR